ncbi:HlyD family type I secretion periplasmic adaptor subunit [Duganella sp. FT109W]|uniref:Membrane fusion protein (MFP) family protein n=1 Tax=Duganella margarita TaxID=2692170 RepID=A0ABW9WF40_9BURK|nr:HlyD family type I secretion periplasmic adaptor subunit [Duganella margarita]MYN39736.1 HlyD family type I secretion periplasmic adaptor subunit [Duganella margarita]
MGKDLITKTEPGAATDVVSRTVTPLEVNTDAGWYSKMGWIVVALGIGGFILWAALAPLDKGVPMSGTVAKEGNRKAVQHLTGGTIQDILVSDGDVVKKGQVLVRMNNVQADAMADSTLAQYITDRAMEARLIAERDGGKAMVFPASLNEFKTDPRTTTAMSLQSQLFSSRRMSLESELSAADENMAGLKMQIQGLEESRDSKKEQLAFLKEQLGGMRELSKDGYVARNRLLELERTYAQIGGAISEDIGNIGRSRRQVIEMSLRRNQRIQDYQKEVRTQLADVQRESEALLARMRGLEYDLHNAEVKSPVDGIVVGSTVFTRGGVVGPGARMMEVVPTGDSLVVEGQLPVNLIDKVHPGLEVELIFSAFNANKTPHIPGVVTQVSADRAVDERSGQPYYKVRAKVSKEGAQLIASKKLDIQPGMPVEMFVKTGERTMMSYLLKPIFDRAHSAMSEE